MSNIRIIKSGMLTTLQDKGRYGFQQYGIPVAGAMDQYSFQLGNLLVGNKETEAVLEFTLIGPTICFEDKRIFAITGGDFHPTLNGKPIKMFQTIYANQDDVLAFSSVDKGCRGYIAIDGGFALPKVMGSQSTYLRGGFGGFEGRKLEAGDIIPLKSPSAIESLRIRKVPDSMIPKYDSEKVIRVILGPEISRFTKAGIKTFLEESYQLSNQCDRMGYRLEGPKIQHTDVGDIVSGGINLGAIQVPGDGKPIIMMADHQTTGGYTKIANVISVDLPYLAQMKPGDKISFQETTVEEAHQLIYRQVEKYKILQESFGKEFIKKKIILKEFNITLKGKTYHVLVEEKSP